MRKDLRIGLGIGGVLLAVLIVALVVRSHGKDPKQQANGQTTGLENDAGNESAPSGEAAPAGPEGQGTPPVATATPGPNDAGRVGNAGKPPTGDVFDEPPQPPGGRAASGKVAGTPNDWEKLLNARVEGDTAITSTPAPRGGNGNRAGGATPGSAAAGLGLSAVDPRSGRSADRMLDPQVPGAAGRRTANRNGTGGGAAGSSGSSATSGTRTYTIRPGDTFARISRDKFGSDRYTQQIVKANPNVNPNALKVGSQIVLPDVAAGSGGQPEARTAGRTNGTNGRASTAIDHNREYQVQSGDSLYKIAQRLYSDGTRADDLYELNKDTIGPDRGRLKIGMVLKLPEPPKVASR